MKKIVFAAVAALTVFPVINAMEHQNPGSRWGQEMPDIRPNISVSLFLGPSPLDQARSAAITDALAHGLSERDAEICGYNAQITCIMGNMGAPSARALLSSISLVREKVIAGESSAVTPIRVETFCKAILMGFSIEEADRLATVAEREFTRPSRSPITTIWTFQINGTGEKFEIQKIEGGNLVFDDKPAFLQFLSSILSTSGDDKEKLTITDDMKYEDAANKLVNFFGPDKVTFLGGRELPSGKGKVVATAVFYRYE
ncbi:MAG: hypothetical protein LBQ08_04650 [Holosporaceae bacterium]|jgi:hypothetical protein|nr:hypothetical protein [Holosporaceae bacterium]